MSAEYSTLSEMIASHHLLAGWRRWPHDVPLLLTASCVIADSWMPHNGPVSRRLLLLL